MSNIIHTIDGDALSKIADYLALQEVLNLAQTSKGMHRDACSLPWFCEDYKGPMLSDGKPLDCDCCLKRFCDDCTYSCEKTKATVCFYCSTDECKNEHCDKACLCCVHTCWTCKATSCFESTCMLVCDICKTLNCADCKETDFYSDCHSFECLDCTGGMYECNGCDERFCDRCRASDYCDGCGHVTCGNFESQCACKVLSEREHLLSTAS